MEWNLKRSEEIKKRIAGDEKLTRELSKAIASALKEDGVELSGMSYIFEPRVFTLSPREIPELLERSSQAMMEAIVKDLLQEGLTYEEAAGEIGRWQTRCLPQCGPMSPYILKLLDRVRIVMSTQDPIPCKTTVENAQDPTQGRVSDYLMRRILGNKALAMRMSQSLSKILEAHKVEFKKNEGWVFTPLVFDTPIFAQKLTVTDKTRIRGFAPRIYAGPSMQGGIALPRPLPGIVESPSGGGPIPALLLPHSRNWWWWIGVPAPELLQGLELYRAVERDIASGAFDVSAGVGSSVAGRVGG